MKTSITFILTLCCFCIPTLSSAETEPCDGGEVKVCFMDGESTSCICKARDIDLHDTTEFEISCYDEDDSGSC